MSARTKPARTVDALRVRAGQRVGEASAECTATGYHHHFEVHTECGSTYDDNIDPSGWLAASTRRARTTSFRKLFGATPPKTRPRYASGDN